MANKLKEFRFQSVADIGDGMVMVAVDQAIREAFLDCADRPSLAKPRKICIEIIMVPETDPDDGDALVATLVTLRTKRATLPPKDCVVRMRPSNKDGGGLEFRAGSEKNPNQKLLEEVVQDAE
jgi:hypothetical protein